ncbi:hypothetical protein [Demequina gelatinilytica]|uniref:hypothetical protein n=1 Tax=Demequina gelatinilytica TaxID=1638980 RepID=UPI000783F587|nr:hypothetical protein [Demequina gelatinilytica]
MNDRDLAVLETTRERRARLAAAFVHGGLESRRRLTDLHKRVLLGCVVGATAVAVCAGVSFVSGYLADRDADEVAPTVAVEHVDETPGGAES